MGKYASKRNYGYGKQMAYAGHQALVSLYGRGHYSTVATHSDRWGQFAQWAKDNGVKDLATTSNQALLERYAEHLQTQVLSGEMAVSTAQNLLSSANTTFLALRGDHRVRVSPSQYAGKRTNVRQTAPTALDTDKVTQTCRALEAAGLPRASAILQLAAAFGVRREEAIKADLDRWHREASRKGTVDVQEGTKGGRSAQRLIAVSEPQRAALAYARSVRPEGSRNLLALEERYADLATARQGELNRARPILKAHGLSGFHDARAAYACARYAVITGHPAPAVSGSLSPHKAQDQLARRLISQELGHNRLDVTVAYLGGRK